MTVQFKPWPSGPLWRHGDFLKLWAAQSVSDFGARITREGLPLAAVLTIRATPAQLGLLAALTLGPGLIVGLTAGGLVDRSRRRIILIGADLARAVVLASVPLAAFLHWLSMGQLYVAAFVVGAASVLFDIADHAYLPGLIDRGLLVEANAKLGVTESVAEMGGPALAGILVQALTAPVAIAVNAVTYLVSALFLAGIRTPEPRLPPSETRPSLAADLAVGFAAVMSEPLVRPLFITSLVQALFGAFFQTLYVIFAIRTLGFSPALLGVTIAMGGVGALGGALLFPALTRWAGFGPAIILAAVVSAASALLIPFAGGPKALAIAMMIAAQLLGDSFGVAMLIGIKSLQQSLFAGHLLGRVGAAMRAAGGAAAIVGAVAGGLLAGPFGIRAMLFVAAAGILVGLIWTIASPLRRLRALPLASA
ncbi:MAG TPA: MFS transporter [Caulobacteraceae bacterium]|jgi:predicted MFS family arabinose efflux permease